MLPVKSVIRNKHIIYEEFETDSIIICCISFTLASMFLQNMNYKLTTSDNLLFVFPFFMDISLYVSPKNIFVSSVMTSHLPVS